MTKEELIQRLKGTEWADFEVKEASRGIPKSAWETVSAFANGAGGWLVLGVKEHRMNGIPSYEITGLDNIEKIEQDMSTTLRSTSKFNVPILATVHKFDIDGKAVLVYRIPPSTCKPVYLNHNLSYTFIRVGSSDQKATDIEIGIFMRERTFGSKSDMTVAETSLEDLHPISIETYRQRLQDFNPELPFNQLEFNDFCDQTGISDNGILTYGGLLMFGKRTVIVKQIRHFWIDYREIPGNSYEDAEARYTYRMPEQENIWEYFQMLIQRLRSFADNPFMTGPNGFSPEDNSQLYCLREGLVNMLAHADYFSPMHSSVIVYNHKIEFQNAGQFPIALTAHRSKVKSLPRNPNIIMFFRYARLAENAGYGIGRILSWRELTGEKVEIDSELAASTVTYFRPGQNANQKIGQKIGQKHDITLADKILELIKENPQISRARISDTLNIASSTVQIYLARLKSENRLKRAGGAKGGHWEIL